MFDMCVRLTRPKMRHLYGKTGFIHLTNIHSETRARDRNDKTILIDQAICWTLFF